MNRRIAIIGAGLAGIAAAVRLVEAGLQPVLIETRKRLGGRATSFDDSRSGQTLDNCQHVLLGCCTNLVDLYDRLGVLDFIEWHRTMYFTDRNGRIDRLKAGWLPAPAHLAGSFARMRLLSFADKRQIARAMWRLIRMGAKGRMPWRDRTFGEFLRDCGQGEAVIRRFWNVIIVSACNMDVERVSAAHAMQVFQDGFLANRWSYAMGLATGPLSELYEPATPMIKAGGGEVRLGVSAKAIAFDGLRVTGVVADDEMINADAVISTVPFDRLDKLVSDSMRGADARLGRLGEFAVSPILGVHLWFDRTIMDLPHMVLVDGGVQWLFNKGSHPAPGIGPGGGGGGQHIHAVISAADDWMDMDEQQIIAAVVRVVHRALPHAVGLQPVQARAVKEKRATFASVPGVDAIRPSASASYVGVGGGGISNLFLAGDWTDTGWPATMEGAVRSGYAAAAAVTGAGGVVEDIPAGRLARMLGL